MTGHDLPEDTIYTTFMVRLSFLKPKLNPSKQVYKKLDI